MVVAMTSSTLLCFYSQATSGGVWDSLRQPAVRRTHLAPTESLDSTYNPAFPVASRYAHHFKPTMLTNDLGSLSEELAEDLLDVPEKRIVTPVWIPTQETADRASFSVGRLTLCEDGQTNAPRKIGEATVGANSVKSRLYVHIYKPA
jgi:hypothetical protein